MNVHIHGCGHPAAPILLCDDPFHIVEYIMWVEDHDAAEAEGMECECFKCYIKQLKEMEK